MTRAFKLLATITLGCLFAFSAVSFGDFLYCTVTNGAVTLGLFAQGAR